jgi:exonuclease SbcC
MRILAIRGENLASLGQPFSIDFEAEPLAGTGLFAITGETGSGKSTILDALCLALYGAYPRFTQSQQDALPDPSGARASISDGGTILRRGSGSGYAEVEFIGQDTQRYRARWEARRAHKKPDGAIQSALRSLHLVHGSTLTPVAITKTEVQRAVEAQTGLTFDQFCRTVLLPQGEFDAFLLAQKNERGALLEKITGTEIYGRISKIVYEGARKLKGEAEQFETRLTNLGLLQPADRESIEQTILTLQQDVASKTSEQHALQARIAHLDNLALAQQRLAAAEQSLLDVRSNSELASPNRNDLAELQAAEPLRPLRDRLTIALREQAPTEQKVIAAKSALQKALLDASNAKTTFDSARAVHDVAEQNFRDFAPLWDEAARLDTESSNAQAEATSASTAAESARAALHDVDTELSGLTEQIKSTELQRQSAAVSLEECFHLLPLADQLSNVEILLGRYESGSAEATKLHKQQAEAAQTAASLRKTLAAADTQVEAETRALQQTTDTALALQQELEDSDEDKWQTEESDLTSLHRQVRDVEHLAESYQLAATLLHRAQAEHQAALIAIAAAAARTKFAEASLLEQTDRRADIQRDAELAEESLDQRNAQLRSLLVEGERCPICGATDHPYAAPEAANALSRLAESLRTQRSELDMAIAVSTRSLQRAATESATAEGDARSADRNVTQATNEMQSAADGFHALRTVIEPSCTNFGFIETLPRALTEDPDAASLLSELLASIEERRSVACEHATALKSLRRRLDDANKVNREAQAALNAATQMRDGERASLHRADLEVMSAAQGANQADARLSEIEQALSPFLTAANISLELLAKNASTVLTTLRKLATEVAALRTRTTELSSEGDMLTEKHKVQAASRRNLADRALDADKNLERREHAYSQVSEARALLLAGEATAQHRTRMNVARLNAQNALQSAQANESSIAANLATVTEQERSAANTLANLLSELTQARNAYNDGCSSLEIKSTRADELLAIPAAETSTLKARLEALDRAIRDAESTLAERRSVLESLPSAEGDTTDRAELAATLENVTTDLNLSLQNIGDQRGRLKHDDALRLTANDLRRQSDEKAVELTTWQQVEDAIGSANGDRFRTFAQSLTLEQLVQLANEHLDSFSRRYQLARSPDAELSLHVIDNDMGEEHRALRSLSGGERFLVSLSLALSLAGLEGHDFSVDTLFIDEGFGALDADTLEIAIMALETLHSRGRKVGVITHVAAMIESIPVQVKVEKLGGGSSVVRLQSPTSYV